MQRRKIEQTTATVAVLLLFILTIGSIIFAADQFFAWDLFTPEVEKVLGFIMICGIMIIFSSVLVNIMLNLSIIAIHAEQIAKRINKNHE